MLLEVGLGELILANQAMLAFAATLVACGAIAGLFEVQNLVLIALVLLFATTGKFFDSITYFEHGLRRVFTEFYPGSCSQVHQLRDQPAVMGAKLFKTPVAVCCLVILSRRLEFANNDSVCS